MENQEHEKLARLPLFDVAFMLQASRRTSWRNDVFARAEATASVLTDERLSTSDLRARFAADGEGFRVTYGDLTAEGLAFARERYDRWLAEGDRPKADRSVAALDAALRKQLAAHRRASAGPSGRG